MLHRWSLFFSLTAGFLLSAGCTSKDPLGCAPEDGSCPSGHVCLSSRCEKLCSGPNDCPRGSYCDGKICVEGELGTPVIDQVTGSSPEDCLPAGATVARPCIGEHLVVVGKNLGGSTTYTLEADEAGLTNIPLSLGASASLTRVELIPDIPLQAGTYTFKVANQSGTDQTSVTLLQGEPGPSGPAGPSGPSGPQGPQGPPGSGNTSGLLYLSVDGVQSSGGVTADRMVIKATRIGAGHNVVDVPDTPLVEICGDEDGCRISLGLIGLDDGSGGPGLAPWMGPVCDFFIVQDFTRRWSVSHDCAQRYEVNFGESDADTLYYRPYAADRWGLDPAPVESVSIDGQMVDVVYANVLRTLGACSFSASPAPLESVTNYRLDYQFRTDVADSAGFHLIAASSDWNAAGEDPALDYAWDATGSCMLVIRD